MNLDRETDSVVTQCRLGKFQISQMTLQHNPTWVQVNVMPYMLIVRMQALISSRPENIIHEIVAYSACFEEIAPGDDVPQYRIEFGDGMPTAVRMYPQTEQELELSNLRAETTVQKEAIADLGTSLREVCAHNEKALPADMLATAVESLAKRGFL